MAQLERVCKYTNCNIGRYKTTWVRRKICKKFQDSKSELAFKQEKYFNEVKHHKYVVYVLQRCFIWNLHVQSEHPRLPSCCSQSMYCKGCSFVLSSVDVLLINTVLPTARLCSTVGSTSLTLMWKSMSTMREQKMET